MLSRESVPDEAAFVAAVNAVRSILDTLKPRDEQETLLIEYFKIKIDEDHTTDDSRLYIYLMLLHFFKARVMIIVNSASMPAKRKWTRFLTHTGFDDLIKRHFDFQITADVMVNEAFLLWIVQ